MTTMTSVYTLRYAVTDAADRIIDVDVWLNDVNIHVEDNDIYYGDGRNQTATAVADSVITFRHINLKHFFCKNKVGAAVGNLSIVGTVDQRYHKVEGVS